MSLTCSKTSAPKFSPVSSSFPSLAPSELVQVAHLSAGECFSQGLRNWTRKCSGIKSDRQSSEKSQFNVQLKILIKSTKCVTNALTQKGRWRKGHTDTVYKLSLSLDYWDKTHMEVSAAALSSSPSIAHPLIPTKVQQCSPSSLAGRSSPT